MLDRSRSREKGLILDCGFREISAHHGREGMARGTGGREGDQRNRRKAFPWRIRKQRW